MDKPLIPARLSDITAQQAVHLEDQASDVVRYPDPIPPDLLLMVDIESLALGVRPVITQVALLGYDLREDEMLDARHVEHYPIDPQLSLNPPRIISGSTLAWWMDQSDEARARFKLSTSTDFEDLVALARGFIQTFNKLTQNGKANYEICAKGPQFDLAAIETLLNELGLEAPWAYDRVVDLRTMLKRAGINPYNVANPRGFVKHVAFWDSRAQINQYLACLRSAD